MPCTSTADPSIVRIVESSERTGEPTEETESSVEGAFDNRLDAMGKDKRRQVRGQTYGPTKTKQLTVYGIFVALVLGLGGLGYWAATTIDERDIALEATAPWAQESAPDIEPNDVDDTGPVNTTGRELDFDPDTPIGSEANPE